MGKGREEGGMVRGRGGEKEGRERESGGWGREEKEGREREREGKVDVEGLHSIKASPCPSDSAPTSQPDQSLPS